MPCPHCDPVEQWLELGMLPVEAEPDDEYARWDQIDVTMQQMLEAEYDLRT